MTGRGGRVVTSECVLSVAKCRDAGEGAGGIGDSGRGEILIGRWSVLIIDGDRQHSTCMAEALTRSGHSVRSSTSGADGVDIHHDADLIVLDLDLPDLDGLEVCRLIRSSCDTPIVVVTSRDTELDCVLALQAGADDYITKPYGRRELIARLEAVMRRVTPDLARPSDSVVDCGPLHIDRYSRDVVMDGRVISVTRKEFDLLLILARSFGGVVTREYIMQEVWKESWSGRTVDTHISSLRSKLGSSDTIVTIRGVGFKLAL
ncbi:response regulator transcription factor [Rhodococcus erythropolis]|uniref:response regulator transcription factor n=1 Tax=Rhodococcus erythropolis TaxID=1833 RepID=UPI00366E5C45